MVTIKLEGVTYSLREGETVLEGLLRHGVAAPYSCQSGVCQTCMMQSNSEAVNPAWQEGLKETFRKQRYFLACQCKPEADMDIRFPSIGDTTVSATILNKHYPCHNVVTLHIVPHAPFPCIPGQYINLLRDGLVRSYSIANIPAEDGYIELHIRLIPGGQMSTWAYELATPGDEVQLRGPAGECFYANDEGKPFDMLLAGTGTGLAPLYGIIRDALKRGHQGNIHLVHGALIPEDLYYVNELRALQAANTNFHYIPAIRDGEPTDAAMEVGALDMLITHYLTNPQNTHAYFCGGPEMVKNLKKQAFLKGVASRHIYSDAFLLAKKPGEK